MVTDGLSKEAVLTHNEAYLKWRPLHTVIKCGH